MDGLNERVIACRRCPRLVEWRERVAREKRRAYRDFDYWGKPVPGFGDQDAWLMIVGLAPGAHGSNRTGRPFTGDKSGDWLYASLHRAGLSSRAIALDRDDGLELQGCYITAVVRCAPPANKPLVSEWENCRPYLEEELEILKSTKVIVCTGAYAFDRVLRILVSQGRPVPKPRPRFGHGVEIAVGDLWVIGTYHPSQQNTFTGKLTEPMLDAIWAQAQSKLVR